jgi:hypothetical protein
LNKETKAHLAVCDFLRLYHPRVMFHSDTGSGIKLSKIQAILMARLRKMRGHPDLLIYIPIGNYVGMMIELKADGVVLYKKDGTLRKDKHIEEQCRYMEYLTSVGWACTFATGTGEAVELIESYLNGRFQGHVRFKNMLHN